MDNYTALTVTVENGVAAIQFNRPERANALHRTLWNELRSAMRAVDALPEARVVVLSGAGAHFCAGIDLGLLDDLRAAMAGAGGCAGRAREAMREFVLDVQDVVNSVERCRKPVLAAVHGACIGAGVDLIAACDMRYCAADAYFSVKEIDLAIVADVGTLQRLPRLIGDGQARELAYTGRKVDGAEAAALGLVNRCYESREALQRGVDEIALTIAAKSPLAMRGTKEMLVYAQDHSVADGLNYVATWNAAMLLSNDLDEAVSAAQQKRAAQFRD
jgi:enoyl-CoA hydratase